MATNWFEEWFDSPLYEKLYVNRDETEARQLITLLEQTLPINTCSKILDLGCGRGRHTINLGQKGYQVKGIDLSPQAIKTAKAKAAELELDTVSFEVGDMREPLDETFDAIVNLFTTFGYFETAEENARVFDSVVAMLKPSGMFVFDYLNAHKVRASFEPSGQGHFQDIDYRIKRYVKDNAIHKDIHFQKPSTGEDKTYSERVKLYELAWFEKQMSQRDLVIDHVYGDYKGADFDPESSPRMLIISHLKQEG